MMRYVGIILFLALDLVGQSGARIESEYKLAIPDNEAEALWTYLSDGTMTSRLEAEGGLTTEISIEDFIDVYFDDEKASLFQKQVGLRFRSRYLGDSLMKQLVQLKTPLNEDGVARTETKYEIKKSMDKNDFHARHSLLKYIKKKDREDLEYHLRKYGTTSIEMEAEVKLKQTRKRIYIRDSTDALATITLDEVTNLRIPYQGYVEMELELNEVRYTNSDESEKSKMEGFNKKLRNELLSAFPSLYQDQTPKYNKMKMMIDESVLSKLYRFRMWGVLMILCLYAGYTLITRK